MPSGIREFKGRLKHQGFNDHLATGKTPESFFANPERSLAESPCPNY
jgi:hypothetical protein